jgi:hypothetical protein
MRSGSLLASSCEVSYFKRSIANQLSRPIAKNDPQIVRMGTFHFPWFIIRYICGRVSRGHSLGYPFWIPAYCLHSPRQSVPREWMFLFWFAAGCLLTVQHVSSIRNILVGLMQTFFFWFFLVFKSRETSKILCVRYKLPWGTSHRQVSHQSIHPSIGPNCMLVPVHTV